MDMGGTQVVFVFLFVGVTLYPEYPSLKDEMYNSSLEP